MQEDRIKRAPVKRVKVFGWSILIAFLLFCFVKVLLALSVEIRQDPKSLFKIAAIKPIPQSVTILQAAAEGQIFPTDWVFLHFMIYTNDLSKIISQRRLVLNEQPSACGPSPKWWQPQGKGYQNDVEKRGYWAREIFSMWVQETTGTYTEVWFLRMQED
jgi:hypothetical protein